MLLKYYIKSPIRIGNKTQLPTVPINSQNTTKGLRTLLCNSVLKSTVLYNFNFKVFYYPS